MKRISRIILACMLLLTLTGCFDNPIQPLPTAPSAATQPNVTTSTQPTVQTDPTQIQEQEPFPYSFTAVSMPIYVDTHMAADGKAIFQYIYQTLELVSQDPEVSRQVILDYLNANDFSGSAAEEIYHAAQNAYTGQEEWQKYLYATRFDIPRIDQSILCLYGMSNYFDGAPQSGSVAHSMTFDLLHGQVLTLRQLLVPDFDSGRLCELILEGFQPEATEFFCTDYAYVIYDLFSTNIPINNWYLSDDGLCFYFNPGEIAPYSEDIPVSTVPYTALGGILQDAYFPPEIISYSGTPTLKKQDTSITPEFDSLAELILAEDAQYYCLQTAGTVTNLKLLSGYWENDTIFVPEATIFAAQALTDHTALLISCTDDALDKICIQYTSSGEEYTKPIKDIIS